MKELKNIHKSVRLSDEIYNRIELWRGNSFNDKLENLLNYCFKRLPELEKEEKCLIREVDRLYEQKKRLLEEIISLSEHKDTLKQTFDAINEMVEDLSEEQLSHKNFRVNQELKRNGFKPTPEITAAIRTLDERTGKRHTLKEIKSIQQYKKYEGELMELVETIGEQLRNQELQHKEIVLEK